MRYVSLYTLLLASLAAPVLAASPMSPDDPPPSPEARAPEAPTLWSFMPSLSTRNLLDGVAADGRLAVLERAIGVWFSSDAGRTWTLRNEGISVYDDYHTLVLDRDGDAFLATGDELFRRARRDPVWVPLDLGVKGEPPCCNNPALPNLALGAEDEVYVLSRWGDEDQVLRSADDGTTWAPVHAGRFYTGLAADGDGLVVATHVTALYQAFMLVSTDHGATWTEHELPTGQLGTPIQVYVAPDRTLYLTQGNFSHHLWRSSDLGVTWRSLGEIGLYASGLNDLHFGSDGALYAGLDEGPYRSTDRGETWRPLLSGWPLGHDGTPRGATFFAEMDGALYAGAYYRGLYTTAPVPQAAAAPSAEAEGGALALAFPNPATSPAAVTFALPEGGHARLAVYDLLGRELAVLTDGAYEAGTHHAQLDPAGIGLASGRYLVRLQASDRVLARSVVVQR